MKELSIEEKAKAYDNRLEKAQKWYNVTTNEGYRVVFEDIFPELKESEDERIRTFLHHTFKVQYLAKDGLGKWHGEPVTNILAWLEKQGEKDKEILVLKDQIESLQAAIKAVKETHRIELEKQCKQNLANSAKTCKDEQEPADRVEPKFKVGDWVVNTITKEVEQIMELTSCEYICSGHLIVSFNNQHLLRKWTIQDAKLGDVLVDVYGNIGIFDKCYDFYWMSCCSLGNNGGFQYFTVEHENEETYPATKEQRDTLMKAMADAGYTFDFDKKELKKIEQENIIKWMKV